MIQGVAGGFERSRGWSLRLDQFDAVIDHSCSEEGFPSW
jgi:hypothetical protein